MSQEEVEEEDSTGVQIGGAAMVDDEENKIGFGHRMTSILGCMSIVSIYNEYYGFDRYKGLPIKGGINAMEERHKARWRKGYSSSEQKHFSRVTQIMNAVKKRKEDGEDLDYILADLSQRYAENGKYSLALLVDTCFQEGWLSKKRQRREE